MQSLLIKDTTRAQREEIVRRALSVCGDGCDGCNGCGNTGGGRVDSIYQPYIDGEKELAEINAAYAEGGPQQAIKAINKNLDLNITQYVTFNWKAVATGINIMGGVDIEISKAEHYYINAFITETVKGTGIGSVQIKKPGMHHMDGVQAVAYGRLRLMDSDYARTERQRLVIQKAFEKCRRDNLNAMWAVENLYIPGNTEEQFTNILEHNLRSVYDGAKLQGYGLWRYTDYVVIR